MSDETLEQRVERLEREIERWQASAQEVLDTAAAAIAEISKRAESAHLGSRAMFVALMACEPHISQPLQQEAAAALHRAEKLDEPAVQPLIDYLKRFLYLCHHPGGEPDKSSPERAAPALKLAWNRDESHQVGASKPPAEDAEPSD